MTDAPIPSRCTCVNCRTWSLASHPEALTLADAEKRNNAYEQARADYREAHPHKARSDV